MLRYARLLRVEQWYKNLVIFLAIFFSGQFLNLDLLIPTVLGYLVFCLTSSSAYIINDIRDVEKDRDHPEKKTRPIAAGEIPINTAAIISLLVLSLALVVGFLLSKAFLYFRCTIFYAKSLPHMV